MNAVAPRCSSTNGGNAPGGSGTAETLSRILLNTASFSPRRMRSTSSMVIVATPARDEDSNFLISGTSCNASSIFSVISDSTRSGLAPG